MKIKDNRGFAIYFVLLFFGCAMIGITSLVNLGATDLRQTRNKVGVAQAFYLAEAATERAKIILRNNYDTVLYNDVDSADFTLGGGEFFYNLDVSPDADTHKRQITGYGAFPDFTNTRNLRAIRVVVRKPPDLPVNFWDYAIYSAEEIDANGNAYQVKGDVLAADDINYSQDHIIGTETLDPTANPLPMLDFQALKAVAQSQIYDGHDNYYTAAEVAAGTPPMPTSFYFEEPSATNLLGTPNVVYVEADLVLNGTWDDKGGFIIVVGDIITGADTTINGNGTIDGVVYTLGEFTVNGGGGGINVDGGVLASDDVTMNGNTNVTYNADYMNSIKNLHPPTGMTVLSWNEIDPDI